MPASVRDDGISALLEPHSKTDTSMAASVMSVNQESSVSDDVDAGAFRLCLEPIQEVHARKTNFHESTDALLEHAVFLAHIHA